MRIPLKFLALAGTAAALSGCAYGDLGFGLGYGSPYGYYGSGYGSPYGYYGAGYGYNSGYGYGYGSPYGYGYGSPYGYGGYGSPYYGWYDNYYYPGTGIYVYDSYRRPHRWTDSQRDYWVKRQRAYVSNQTPTRTRTVTTRPALRENWSDFRKQRVQSREDRREARQQRRTERRERNDR